MKLTTTQRDRAAAVLLGQAIGDALGVPYEFAARIRPGEARMIGGGLGPYAPGEWSDDTQMAICIAQVTSSGAGVASDAGLDAVAAEFVGWQANGASDIGVQTSSVLAAARRATGPLGPRMTAAAEDAARSGRAGNGALMRTGVVGLVALDDPDKTADAARRVAALTHAAPECLDSCVLWAEAVRVAVVEGRLDVRSGLRLLPTERRAAWAGWLDVAEQASTSEEFFKNGYTVTALQAAWWAIHSTSGVSGPDHVEAALQAAIAIGHDTDTVAAIAGALVGARYGVSGLRTDLARRVHGWPGMTGRDLIHLALATATGDATGWPATASMLSGEAAPTAVPHPDDAGVLLGTEADLARCSELGVTAVVSLSRVGVDDRVSAAVVPDQHVEVWLVDSDHPADNAHLAWTLHDAAETVRTLREAGERVLLHCVHAHHRTPSVALAYSRLLGVPVSDAAPRICRALDARPEGNLLWETTLNQT